MKILYVFRTCQGGLKRHLKIIGNKLPEVNITPIFCGPEETLDNYNLSVNYHLPIYDKLSTGNVLANIYKLRNIILKEQPDLIHSHGYKASLITYGATKFSSVPWICTIHNFSKWRQDQQFFDYMANQVTKNMLAAPEKIICVSKSLQQEIEAQGINESKIQVIYNGIPILNHHNYIYSSIFKNPHQKVIACIGRLIPDKGIDNFIKAVKVIADTAESFVDFMNLHFIIVGDGPYKQHYQRLSWELKISPHISFVGNREDIADILKQIDVLCIPSRYEGQSITAVEAMASFCPVVASKSGGLEEVISHGETGLLIDKNDYRDLARKMIYLTKNRKLKRRLTFKAYQYVLSNFSDINMVNYMVKLYNEVTYERAKSSK